MDGRWLLLETSEVARAGLALDGDVVASVALPKGREHNRALVPTVGGLLEQRRWKVAELSGIAVGIGPGSYTGLRIGLMLAKTLAYATGCKIVAVPTFHWLAASVDCADEVDVIADALKQTVYAQKFGPAGPLGVRLPTSELRALKLAAWIATVSENQAVTGPGLELHSSAVPATVRTVPSATVDVFDALVKVARSLSGLSRDELFSLEPLYVRGSSAEEKAKELALS